MSDISGSTEVGTYKGSCHCGAFKFSIKDPELTSVIECNCSFCSKKGYKWVVYSTQDPLTVEKDDGKLKEYQFAKKNLTFMFCSVCGTSVMGKMLGDPNGELGLNATSLNDVDFSKFGVQLHNGAALDPPYTPPRFTGTEPTVEIKGAKIYTGGCHCGAVTLAFKSKPLPKVSQSESGVLSCDCSICTRNSTINTYTTLPQVSIAGEENLTTYLFRDKHNTYKFCKTCGIVIYINSSVGLEIDPWEPLLEDGPKRRTRAMTRARIALNVRCLDGVEWENITLKKSEGCRLEPKYAVGRDI